MAGGGSLWLAASMKDTQGQRLLSQGRRQDQTPGREAYSRPRRHEGAAITGQSPMVQLCVV